MKKKKNEKQWKRKQIRGGSYGADQQARRTDVSHMIFQLNNILYIGLKLKAMLLSMIVN